MKIEVNDLRISTMLCYQGNLIQDDYLSLIYVDFMFCCFKKM